MENIPVSFRGIEPLLQAFDLSAIRIVVQEADDEIGNVVVVFHGKYPTFYIITPLSGKRGNDSSFFLHSEAGIAAKTTGQGASKRPKNKKCAYS